jgi:hypothetical protein
MQLAKAEGGSGKVAVRRTESLPGAGVPPRVLVVEDTWCVADALKNLFEIFGIQVLGPPHRRRDGAFGSGADA